MRPQTIFLLALSAGVLPGCDSLLGPEEDDGVEYVVERLEVVSRDLDGVPFPVAYLVTELALVNRGPDSLYLEYGDCAMKLEGALAEPGPGPAVWRSERSLAWPWGVPSGCLDYLATARVAPGDTLRPRELTYSVRLARILADSLPSGRYAFEATVARGLPARRVDLGSVLLPTSRHPLPEDVVARDGFRYTVAVDAAAGGHRVSLRVDLAAPRDFLERSLSRSCPVRILAYPDESALTTIPLPEPAWSWPRDCPAGEEPVRLESGESRTFESILAAADLPGAAPGTYHLVGVIEADGRSMHLIVDPIELSP